MARSHHPLHDAIGAGAWDAEAPLGRIVLVAHAAFLDAGFVSCGKPARRLPRQVGLAASTLPLRYSIPELVRPRNAIAAAAADAAVLRLCVHGDFLVLYGYLAGDGNRPSTRWACVDALFVAPVLSGDLVATARALASDALGVRLWKALACGLARLLFLDICARNVALLPPRLTSLPADLQAVILSRLAGVDLAMVECTCTELRDLVAGRELWRARFMAERRRWFFLERSVIDGSSRSWKENYVATRWWLPWPRWRGRRLRALRWLMDDLRLSFEFLQHDSYALWVARCEIDRHRRQDPTERLMRRFQRRRSKVPAGDGHRRATAVHGNGRRLCREEAIYSPPARQKWTHR